MTCSQSTFNVTTDANAWHVCQLAVLHFALCRFECRFESFKIYSNHQKEVLADTPDGDSTVFQSETKSPDGYMPRPWDANMSGRSGFVNQTLDVQHSAVEPN